MDTFKTGQFIKELREKEGLSQNELADKLYVSRTLVNKWEKGRVTLTSPNLKLLSDFFNVSTDEILAGEKINKKNKNTINNIRYSIYDNYIKTNNKLKFLLGIIIVLIFSFLIYFFFTFYNSIYVYTLSTGKDNTMIRDGLLVKMPDKIYMRFTTNFDKKDKVDSIALYYLKDDKKYIVKSSNYDIISINDSIEVQEYFDFGDFNGIIDNLFFEVNYSNGEIVDFKIYVSKNYVNSKFFFKKMRNDSKEHVFKEYNYFDVDEKYIETSHDVNYENTLYHVSILDESIVILYDDYFLMYSDGGYATLEKKKSDKDIYTYNLINEFCIDGDCSKSNEDILLIKTLINLIIK